jgi:hypothetical protein
MRLFSFRGRGLPGSIALRLSLAACLAGAPVLAEVLPDDRADALYHRYDGGGIEIQGPSVLVRKKVGDNVSLSANYYADIISGASIDVQTSGASPIRETRRQWSGSVDYQHGKTSYTLGYISSVEPDYQAKTGYFSLSQNMFGDLTTVTLAFRRGWDDIEEMKCVAACGTDNRQVATNPDFNNGRGYATSDHRAYSFGLSQILTRNLLLNFNYEKITDQGYLANPYRSIRYLQGSTAVFAAQIYPGTHTSDAVSGQLKYYLPYRAALTGSYRFYNDTWGVIGHTGEISYVQPWKQRWTFEGSARYYTQTHADFYSDLFPYANYSNYMARDRELASFYNIGLGVGVSYELPAPASWLQRSSINFRYDHLMINYRDFRNALYTATDGAGNEPLYTLNANVIQLFVSVWY